MKYNNNKGIYIHIPFCVQKCVYCDFLSAPAGEEIKKEYVDTLIAEIRNTAKECENDTFDTVFIGGGTPSAIDSKDIVRIMQELKMHYNITDYAEITMECNPGTVDESKMLDYKEAGINRISFGVQSGLDEELLMLGRIHDTIEAKASFDLARKCGFNNINIDLMSGIPGQNLDKFVGSLKFVLALAPEHISAYSLIVEEGTHLADNLSDFPAIPDEEMDRAIYHKTREILKAYGYEQYEISNYAKPGYECKHNLHYWNRDEYVGFGIGAASFNKDMRYTNVSDINEYMEHKGVVNSIRENVEHMTDIDGYEEFMFLGLRKTKGIDVLDFRDRFGKDIDEIYGETINKHITNGLLEKTGNQIKLTSRGIDISNTVMSDFIIS